MTEKDMGLRNGFRVITYYPEKTDEYELKLLYKKLASICRVHDEKADTAKNRSLSRLSA